MNDQILDFSYIEKLFSKCGRDAHSVFQWLTAPKNMGGKGIDESIAIEVMVEFAARIDGGEMFSFNEANVSELSKAVFRECELRQNKVAAVRGTKIIQELAGKSVLDKEINELSDDLFEMLRMVYWKLNEKQFKKAWKPYKKHKSVWTKPISQVLPKLKGKKK